MKKRSLFVLMAAALLASCSNNDNVEMPVVNADNEIMLKSKVKIAAGTRTAYEGNNLSAVNLEALVLGSEDADFSTVHSYGTMLFDGGANAIAYAKPMLDGVSKFPAVGTSLFLTGFYPGDPQTANGWTLAAKEASLEITGYEDVMYAETVEDENTSATRDITADYKTLAFNHQLTWIKIKVTGDADAVADLITVTGIKLTHVDEADVNTKVVLDLENKAVSYEAGSETTLACYAWGSDDVYDPQAVVEEYDKDTDTPAIDGIDEQVYVLAPPATTVTTDGSAINYTFEVSFSENGVDATPTIVRVALTDTSITDLTGYNVALHLHFIGRQIRAFATVTDWVDGPTSSIDI